MRKGIQGAVFSTKQLGKGTENISASVESMPIRNIITRTVGGMTDRNGKSMNSLKFGDHW